MTHPKGPFIRQNFGGKLDGGVLALAHVFALPLNAYEEDATLTPTNQM